MECRRVEQCSGGGAVQWRRSRAGSGKLEAWEPPGHRWILGAPAALCGCTAVVPCMAGSTLGTSIREQNGG